MKNRAWKPVRREAKVGFRVAGPGFRVRVYRGLAAEAANLDPGGRRRRAARKRLPPQDRPDITLLGFRVFYGELTFAWAFAVLHAYKRSLNEWGL